MTLQGKTIWITGASSGIGEALARECARRGGHLVLSARRVDALEAVRRACDRPRDHAVVPIDLEDTASIDAAAARVRALGRPLDVLVNNAGIRQRSLALETELALDRRMLEVNVLGTIAVTKAVLPSMLERGAGRIVVVSSIAGKIGTPHRSAYSASKHALHGYFDALRAEISDAGVGVTIVCPGFVRTEGTPGGADLFRPGGGLPVATCARKIARAVEHERDEVYIARWERIGVVAQRLAPALVRWALPRLRMA